MVKRFLAMLSVLLLLMLCGSALAERPMVIDDAGILGSTSVEQLERIIQDIQSTFKMDAVVWTTRQPSMSDQRLQDVADRYYEDHGYGLGSDRAGVLLMIDMGNRYIWISTAGVMIDYLDDSDIQDVIDKGYDYALNGSYGQCAVAIMQAVRDDLTHGIKEGHFRFDAETGERLSGIYNKLTTTEALVSLLVGALAALLAVMSVNGKYALKESTYQFDALTQVSCDLTVDKEQFLRQSVVRTRNAPPPSNDHHSGGGHSGGSSVHVSSGGMTHGGGGRHF